LGRGRHHHPSLPYPSPTLATTPYLLAQDTGHPSPAETLAPNTCAHAPRRRHHGVDASLPMPSASTGARRLGPLPLITPPWRRHPGPTRWCQPLAAGWPAPPPPPLPAPPSAYERHPNASPVPFQHPAHSLHPSLPLAVLLELQLEPPLPSPLVTLTAVTEWVTCRWSPPRCKRVLLLPSFDARVFCSA
jgi:hypothetical protein